VTENQLRHAINEGLLTNEVHRFFIKAKKLTGHRRICKKVVHAAWQLYAKSMQDVPMPKKAK
jgi:hypothetical protein